MSSATYFISPPSIKAHQGRGEADCAGGTGAYQKRSGAV